MFTPVFSGRRRAFRMTKLCSNRFECITRMLPRDVEVVAEIGYDLYRQDFNMGEICRCRKILTEIIG